MITCIVELTSKSMQLVRIVLLVTNSSILELLQHLPLSVIVIQLDDSMIIPRQPNPEDVLPKIPQAL